MNNFEEKLQKLEELSNDIKRSGISLEDALKDFEEGIKLAKVDEKWAKKNYDKIYKKAYKKSTAKCFI